MVIEAFEELRSGGRVLICSGYVPEELAMHGVESGAFDFLAKPFTASRLVSKLDSILAAAQRPSGR